jgi:hypothetical protein
MKKEYRNLAGMKIEVVNYEGVLLQKNPLTKSWFLCFIDPATAPFSGTLFEIKGLVDDFKKRDMLDVLLPY